ncbi:MAG: DNA methyltransferase [Promethearchaeota archaeon]
MAVHYYFKLSNSIKEKHEVDFAELELTSLFGKTGRVRNFVDVMNEEPLKLFTTDNIRIQDILTHELPYGEFHGFYGTTEEIQNVSNLVRKLAYTREFFQVIKSSEDPERLLNKIFPEGILGKNVQYFKSGNHILFRFIVHQYFLEKSQYISKLSRNEEEVDRNVNSLFDFLTNRLYRIPASSTMAIGKRLEDYFAIREEPSLYLTHYMHPYKGKFHPKMVRALLNYVFPNDQGLIMDNFAGSGTLLVEASLLGLDSIGIEINPLSVLMSNVKCHSLFLDTSLLRRKIESFLKRVNAAILCLERQSKGDSLLVESEYNYKEITARSKKMPDKMIKLFYKEGDIKKILVAHEIAKSIPEEQIKNFLLLGLSGTISDLTRRRRAEFVDVLEGRLRNLYLRIYLFHKLNEVLKIRLGKSETYIGDTRDMRNSCKKWNNEDIGIKTETIDAIVNSPPYSTALDYIKNDYPQLTLLDLVPSLEKLHENMVGNPNLRHYPRELIDEIKKRKDDFQQLPETARAIILNLLNGGRRNAAMRTYKFFKDIRLTLKEMSRVMKREAKCVIIIGNNHYKLDSNYVEVKNDKVIWEMAKDEDIALTKDRVITRELEKTREGMIRYESVVILSKK